jgi:hypothetical protein
MAAEGDNYAAGLSRGKSKALEFPTFATAPPAAQLPACCSRLVVQDAGGAGYFVAASAIANFLPAEFGF